MNVYIITDLVYGDTGKGSTVNFIAKTLKPYSSTKKIIVIRSGGGHQVGHTVKSGDRLHNFHNFGCGSFENIPTYYADSTTMNWEHLYAEWIELDEKFKCNPINYYHPDTAVTTVFDIMYNRWLEDCRNGHRHGSVGLGFGATLERNEKVVYNVFQSLSFSADFLKEKYISIKNYYLTKGLPEDIVNDIDIDAEIDYLIGIRNLNAVKKFINVSYGEILKEYNVCIFEGHQGVLLDKSHGIFPHVTRSYTTCRSALTFIDNYKKFFQSKIKKIFLYDISRIYHTRHGAGPFEIYPITLINTEHESNHMNLYQKEFKISAFQPQLFSTAVNIQKSESERFSQYEFTRTLIFTCFDQLPGYPDKISIPIAGETENLDKSGFVNLINELSNNSYESIFYSDSAEMKLTLIAFS